MTNPVPGYGVSTPYGRRGRYWGCNKDAAGNGLHTGADFAAPAGTPVVAARPGVARYVHHGTAFGRYQLLIRCADGTADFYAHMRSRAVANGALVKAGQKVGEVGADGNVTGPHLHFERHASGAAAWSCSLVRDPAASIAYRPPTQPPPKDDDMPLTDADIEKIARRVNQVLGDYDAKGKVQPNYAKGAEVMDQRLRQIENVVRRIEAEVKKKK